MKVVINKAERLLKAPQALTSSMKLTEKLLKSRGLEYIDLDPVRPEAPDYGPFLDKIKEAKIQENISAAKADVIKLKEKLAEFYQTIYGSKLNPAKDIVITPGSRATAILLCLGLINPGDIIALPDPGLAMYRLAAVMAGGSPLTYGLLEKNDYLPNLSALFEPPAKNHKLVFLNYPHNPTGAEAELFFYRDLINQARNNNILLVLDTPYCGQPEPPIDLPLQLKKADGLFLELHSFGFPYGLDGLGFAIGHRGAIAVLDQAIQAGGFQPSQAAVTYARIALDFHDGLSESYSKRISYRRAVLADGLKEIGWKVRSGRLGPFIWAKTPVWTTSVGFTRKLFLRTGVRVRPGTDFGENGEGCIRLSLTTSNQQISKALENIRAKQSMYRKRGS